MFDVGLERWVPVSRGYIHPFPQEEIVCFSVDRNIE